MSDRRSKSAASGRAKTIKRTDQGTAEIPQYLPDVVRVTLRLSLPACEWRALGEIAAGIRARTGAGSDFDEFAVLRTHSSSEIAQHMLRMPARDGCNCRHCMITRKGGA